MQNKNCKLQNADGLVGDTNRTAADPRPSTPSELSDRFLDFADRVASAVEALPDTRLSRRIADQLLRSGTSPLGNYEEACAAESKADFVHKLRICLKEVRESRGWLRLTARRELLNASRLGDLIAEADQLARIIGQSIATARGIAKKNREIESDGS